MRYALVNNEKVVRTTVEGQTEFIKLDNSIVSISVNDVDRDSKIRELGFIDYEEIESDSLIRLRSNPFKLYVPQLEFEITESKVTGTVVSKPLELADAKIIKRMEIKSKLSSALSIGKVASAVIGIQIDCRRSANDDDVQNIDNLIYLIENELVNLPIEFIGVTESVTINDIDTLKEVKKEMVDYIYQQYQTKFEKNKLIEEATTIEELERI